jgi:hypothetical protein
MAHVKLKGHILQWTDLIMDSSSLAEHAQTNSLLEQLVIEKYQKASKNNMMFETL